MSRVEIEAKLEASDRAVLDRIAGRRRLGPYRLVPLSEAKLQTLYLDTRAGDLGRARLALRIRKSGRAAEVTIKGSGEKRRGVYRRPEWTLPLARVPRLPFRASNEELLARLPDAVRSRPLRPFLETRVRRRALLARLPGRREPIAEIDLDEVELRLPRRVPPRTAARGGERYCEVEVELKGGSAKDLAAIVRLLRAGDALRPSAASKLERGLRWARTAGHRGDP